MDLPTQLALFISPLISAFSSQDAASELLAELNLVSSASHVGILPESLLALADEGTQVVEILAALAEDDGSLTERSVQAINAARAVMDLVGTLGAINDAELETLTYPFETRDTWETLAQAIPAYLMARWLQQQHPIVYASLELADGLNHNGRGGVSINFDSLENLFTDPVTSIKTTALEHAGQLWGALHLIVSSLGLLQPTRELRFEDGVVVVEEPNRLPPTPPGFRLGVTSDTLGVNWILEVDMQPPPGNVPGVQLTAHLAGDLEVDASLSPTWNFTASAGSDGTIGFLMTPDGIKTQPEATVEDAAITIEGTPETPWALLGKPETTRLELAGMGFKLVGHELLVSPELSITLETEGLRFVVRPTDGDSFLSGVLGAEFSTDASLALAWSSENGVTFGGSAGFDLTIPIYRTLGPIRFDTLRLTVQAGNEGITSELAAVVGLALGPIDIIVDGIGLTAGGYPAETPNSGAFGDLDFSVTFRPPNGIGISIDEGPIQGGGYLYIDHEKGEYAGVVDINLFEVGITAIGLIATKIPEIQGWSMFLSLSAQFTGFQLGFGFTLNGVGGLIGINRGLDEDALADGVRSGSLDSLLFPDDPVANAPRIIADMNAVFPPAEGQFVFGPILKLGWGTPTLVELDLGVIIQLPDPLTITLLGALEVVLPTKEVPIVELRVDVAGTVNITEGTLKVDASLRDSSVAGLSLTGDLAIRASFLDSPSFLFSFGGFHPAFSPPQGFPTLARLGVGLDTGDSLRITLGGYFAVSSSTLQFGAACEIWAKAIGFTAEGGTSFDAMIIYKPFGFLISLKIWVSISAGKKELFGVLLAGDLKGPNRWHAKGLAEFKLLGVKKKLEVDVRFGDAEEEEPAELINVEALLLEAIQDPGSWTVIPAAISSVVLAESESESLSVHPAGAIEVRQRIVPLDLHLEKYGNANVLGENRFVLSEASINDVEIDSVEVEDWFAASQYLKMSDAERLAAPSFEMMPAGLRLEGTSMSAGDPRSFTPDFEVKVRDPAVRKEPTSDTGKKRKARSLRIRSRPQKKVASAKRGPTLNEVSYVSMNTRTGSTQATGTQKNRYYAVRNDIARSAKPTAFTAVPTYELEDAS